MTWMDRPGFSLCAVPLELSGLGFQGMGQGLDERAEVQRYTGPEFVKGDLRVRGGVKVVNLIGDEVTNGLG